MNCKGCNKGCLKGCLYSMAILISIFVVMFVVYYEKRDFHKVGEMEFTSWNLYVMPYKYYGLCPPKNNYLLTHRFCFIDIFIDKDSTLHIFGDRGYKNTYNAVPNVVEIHLDSRYKYTYMQKEYGTEEYQNNFIYYSQKKLPHFSEYFGDLGAID